MTQWKLRDARNERQWRQWIPAWQASGSSVRVLCARYGLAEPSFYAWRKKLARRDAVAPAFVPVQVVPDEAAAAAGGVGVVLAGGRMVRVSPGFDAATLQRVVAVLEEQGWGH